MKFQRPTLTSVLLFIFITRTPKLPTLTVFVVLVEGFCEIQGFIVNASVDREINEY